LSISPYREICVTSQKASQREAEVSQRRRRGIVAANALSFIAVNGKASRMALLPHPLQRLGVGFQNDFALDLNIFRHFLFVRWKYSLFSNYRPIPSALPAGGR
jgi:hypothetical protein